MRFMAKILEFFQNNAKTDITISIVNNCVSNN